MSTDNFLQIACKDGFHRAIRVTPLEIPAETRMELPPGGVHGQLRGRKTMMLQNIGSGIVWIGDNSVEYGTGDEYTCSGIKVDPSGAFVLDSGRIRVYAYNPNPGPVHIKLLEAA